MPRPPRPYVAYVLNDRDEVLGPRPKLWLGSAFALSDAVTTLAASTIVFRPSAGQSDGVRPARPVIQRKVTNGYCST